MIKCPICKRYDKIEKERKEITGEQLLKCQRCNHNWRVSQGREIAFTSRNAEGSNPSPPISFYQKIKNILENITSKRRLEKMEKNRIEQWDYLEKIKKTEKK